MKWNARKGNERGKGKRNKNGTIKSKKRCQIEKGKKSCKQKKGVSNRKNKIKKKMKVGIFSKNRHKNPPWRRHGRPLTTLI